MIIGMATKQFSMVLKYDQLEDNVFNEIIFDNFVMKFTKLKNYEKSIYLCAESIFGFYHT